MTPQSRKAKGRAFQQLIRDTLLAKFPQLLPDDIQSRSMGSPGEDLMLSPKARDVLLNTTWEAKHHKAIAIYKWFAQATRVGHEPILVVKQNKSKPLAIVDLDFLLKLIEKSTPNKSE